MVGGRFKRHVALPGMEYRRGRSGQMRFSLTIQSSASPALPAFASDRDCKLRFGHP